MGSSVLGLHLASTPTPRTSPQATGPVWLGHWKAEGGGSSPHESELVKRVKSLAEGETCRGPAGIFQPSPDWDLAGHHPQLATPYSEVRLSGRRLTQEIQLLSSEGVSSPHPGAGLSCARGRAGRETFPPVSQVFIPASQYHHHRHHLQKGGLGAGVPSCSPRLHLHPQFVLQGLGL